MYFLLPGRKLKAAKVMDLATLLQFVPAYHQKFYLELIESHEEIVEAYQATKKKKAEQQRKTKASSRAASTAEQEGSDIDEM